MSADVQVQELNGRHPRAARVWAWFALSFSFGALFALGSWLPGAYGIVVAWTLLLVVVPIALHRLVVKGRLPREAATTLQWHLISVGAFLTVAMMGLRATPHQTEFVAGAAVGVMLMASVVLLWNSALLFVGKSE